MSRLGAKPSRCFFVHVMKTGGTTFLRQLKRVFAPNEVYPFLQGEERRLQYTMLDELRKLGPEQRASLRMYCGHFPFLATSIVEPDFTMAILRDPVEQVGGRLGWRLGAASNQRVSTEGWDVSQSFRDRIAGDIPAEMEFYEYALALHERRRV